MERDNLDVACSYSRISFILKSASLFHLHAISAVQNIQKRHVSCALTHPLFFIFVLI